MLQACQSDSAEREGDAGMLRAWQYVDLDL
jgi:hypothetical protein